MSSDIAAKQEPTQMLRRLIDWNADVLLKLLKKVVANREPKRTGGWDEDPVIKTSSNINEERVDVIHLPPFDKDAHKFPKSTEIAPQVEEQLKELKLVQQIRMVIN